MSPNTRSHRGAGPVPRASSAASTVSLLNDRGGALSRRGRVTGTSRAAASFEKSRGSSTGVPYSPNKNVGLSSRTLLFSEFRASIRDSFEFCEIRIQIPENFQISKIRPTNCENVLRLVKISNIPLNVAKEDAKTLNLKIDILE